MPLHHRRSDDPVPPVDSELAALGRVKLATWRQIIGAFMWLGAVTAGSSATAVAVTHKLDTATYNIQRQDDRDLLAAKLDALDRRLQSIETFQARQAAAAEQAAAIAAAIRAQQPKP